MIHYQTDGKIYYLDLNAVFSLITETPANEKLVNTTITQYYGDDENGNGKEIVETRGNLNEVMNNVRYDFIKNIVNILLMGQNNADGFSERIYRLNEMSFAQGLCFNTLIEHNILRELENNNG